MKGQIFSFTSSSFCIAPLKYFPKKTNLIFSKWYCRVQGRRQGKSLEGAKLPRGSRGQRSLAGVQGAEPLGGGQGAKPPEADAF